MYLVNKYYIIMEYLGYIVADRKLNNIKDFVGFSNDLPLLDSTKPVLVVGLKRAKNILGEKFNILDKRISNNVYWTFKKTEKRDDFENDLSLFYKICIENVVHEVKYYYVNFINLKYSKVKKMHNILFSDDKKYIYINNNMIYVLYEKNVLGLSLSLLKYCGIDNKKILEKLKNNKNNKIYGQNSNLARKVKRELRNSEYIIPYFMSIE